MENELIKRFEESFRPVDKRVKEEELILFLDKRVNGKFDRETFAELKSRVLDKKLELTPVNFARTYYSAHELLGIKKQRAFADRSNQERMLMKLKSENDKEVIKLLFEDISIENPSDSSNYLTIEYSPDYAVNFYDFSGEQENYLLLPQESNDQKISLRVTLNTPKGAIIDTKNVALFGETHIDPTKLKFKDSSTLYFSVSKSPVSLSDYQLSLSERKSDLTELESFAVQKRNYLASAFPDVFFSASHTSGRKLSCGFYLIVACVLTGVIGFVGLYLNFTRCMFLDIFIALAFFNNIYIWRVFNLFLAIKLILVLFVSVLLDVYWEIHKLMVFNDKYEYTVKVERIKGLVLTGILVLCKLSLIFLYYKLSREKREDGFLSLDEQVSINEVDADDYLMNPVNSKIG